MPTPVKPASFLRVTARMVDCYRLACAITRGTCAAVEKARHAFVQSQCFDREPHSEPIEVDDIVTKIASRRAATAGMRRCFTLAVDGDMHG
jgi:hypothetical protein